MAQDQYGRLSFLESQPLSTERYHDDPEFNANVTSLTDQIYPLVHSISALINVLAPLGTANETDVQRIQARDSLRDARELATTLSAKVERVLANEDVSPAQFLQQKHLRTSFSTALTELTTTHRIFLEKTRQYLDTLHHAQQQHTNSDQLAGEIAENLPSSEGEPGAVPNAPIVAQQLALVETTQPTPDPQLSPELERERLADLEETEKGLEKVRELMGALGLKMVEEETRLGEVGDEVEEVAEDVGEVLEEVKERSGVDRWGGRVCVGLVVFSITAGLILMAWLGDRSREKEPK